MEGKDTSLENRSLIAYRVIFFNFIYLLARQNIHTYKHEILKVSMPILLYVLLEVWKYLLP
jgi:hypothetical protein